MPSASQFLQVSTCKKLGKLKPTDVRRQCLLSWANFPQGVCVSNEASEAADRLICRMPRQFCDSKIGVCCTSLGECPTTHKGVTAHASDWL